MSTPASVPPPTGTLFPIYAGTNGHVVALNALDGVELWRQKLPGASGIISLMPVGDDLYAGAFGHVFCLNRHTGEILWTNDLKGLGYSPVMLACETATPSSAPMAASIDQQTPSD